MTGVFIRLHARRILEIILENESPFYLVRSVKPCCVAVANVVVTCFSRLLQ